MKLFPQKERVRDLPILPTQHTLIFPGHASTLFVTQDSAKTAIAAATTEGGRSFLAVPQKELNPIPKPDDLYRVGDARVDSPQHPFARRQPANHRRRS